MNLPDKLSRKAIIQEFSKVSEARWNYLFMHEKTNGLFELRVEGNFSKAYYRTDGIIKWLVMEATYRSSDFDEARSVSNSPWSKATVRTHVLTG